MTNKTLRVILIAAVVVMVFFGIAYLRGRPPVAVGPSATAPDLTVTGTYANDWQANCGPLVGDAQAACAARLDARYGKTAESPVPPAEAKKP